MNVEHSTPNIEHRMKWWADQMYLMVPAQTYVGKELATLKEFPPARGSSLSLGKLKEEKND